MKELRIPEQTDTPPEVVNYACYFGTYAGDADLTYCSRPASSLRWAAIVFKTMKAAKEYGYDKLVTEIWCCPRHLDRLAYKLDLTGEPKPWMWNGFLETLRDNAESGKEPYEWSDFDGNTGVWYYLEDYGGFLLTGETLQEAMERWNE